MRWLLFLYAVPVMAQTNGSAMPFVEPQFFTTSGVPASSYKICTWAAGTTSPILTYNTSTLSVPNTNPVVLDAGGRAPIFLSANSYKIALLTPTSTTLDCVTGTMSFVWTQDNIANNADLLRLTLQTNGVNNGSQNILNLQQGTNVTISSNGTGTITISALTLGSTISGNISTPILTLTQTGSGTAITLSAQAAAALSAANTSSTIAAIAATNSGAAPAISATNNSATYGAITATNTGGFAAISATANGSAAAAVIGSNTGTGPGLEAANNSATAGALYAFNTGGGPDINFAGHIDGQGVAYASLPTSIIASSAPLVFCNNCNNFADDSVTVGTVATAGGHGAYVTKVNGTWRTMN